MAGLGRRRPWVVDLLTGLTGIHKVWDTLRFITTLTEVAMIGTGGISPTAGET